MPLLQAAKAPASKKLVPSQELTLARSEISLPSTSVKRPQELRLARSETSAPSTAVKRLQKLAEEMDLGKPQYTVVEEKSHYYAKKFMMQVKIPRVHLIAEGNGNSKVEAKRTAATRMLDILELLENRQSQSGFGRASATRSTGRDTPTLAEGLEQLSLSGGDGHDPRRFESEDLHTNAILTLATLVEKRGIKVKYFKLPEDREDQSMTSCIVKIYSTPPIVTHGTGVTSHMAYGNAAQNMLQHIEVMEKAGKSVSR